MKTLILVVTLIASQAFSYNTKYTSVTFGQQTEVEMGSKNSNDSKVVSLLVELNSTTGRHPMVQVANKDQKNCSHKQTLIMFSGYDLETKTYKRIYEVQIEREPSKACYVVIYASTSAQDKVKAARVNILPNN